MKAKELFIKMEKFNKLADEFGKTDIMAYVTIDECTTIEFENYKEYKKYIKNEYDWGETIIDGDFEEIDKPFVKTYKLEIVNRFDYTTTIEIVID